jgi:hypothetical protein
VYHDLHALEGQADDGEHLIGFWRKT